MSELKLRPPRDGYLKVAAPVKHRGAQTALQRRDLCRTDGA